MIHVKKKAFVLRVDPEIIKAIEKWAADEFRSTNGQLEWIISEPLRKSGRLSGKTEIIKTIWIRISIIKEVLSLLFLFRTPNVDNS